jgi:hypothetical protein
LAINDINKNENITQVLQEKEVKESSISKQGMDLL